MKPFNFKFIIGSIAIALTLQSTTAQSVARIGYFMDNATHKHLMNPALIPTRGYISYPVLGSVDFGIESNMGFTNFMFPGATANDPLLTFMHEDVTPEQFLSQLSPDNYFKLDQRLSLLSFGFYTGRSFWTFEVASRINTKMNIPYDFFAFLKQGMSSEAGNTYQINDLSVSAGLLAETSLGSSFMVTDDIRVGVKGKLLVGGARALGGIDQMTIDMRPDAWTVTTNGLVNLYGAGFDFTYDTEGVLDGFEFNTPNMAGMGFAMDLGASWKPFDFLEVSAGVLDIGTIKWNAAHNRVARSSGTVTYSGFDKISLGDDENGGESSMDDQMTDMMDGFLDMAQFKEADDSGSELNETLHPTFNLAAEGGVLNNKITLGLLYTNRMMPVGSRMSEITGVLNLKPISRFNVAASYSLLNGVQKTFGAAMGLDLFIANIFLACDYIPMYVTPQFIPLNHASTHIQLGLSVNLGKMKIKE